MNPVVIAVLLMLILSMLRINVVVSLAVSAIVGGLVGGLSLMDTLKAFTDGLGGGATIALSYAMLGLLQLPSVAPASRICWHTR